MRIGRMNKMVLLDDPVPDGTPVLFEPAIVPAAVVPDPPGSDGERRVTYTVEMRYHSQVTFNTRIRFSDDRGDHELFVKGIQNPEMRNRELVLFCEEVQTP